MFYLMGLNLLVLLVQTVCLGKNYKTLIKKLVTGTYPAGVYVPRNNLAST